MGRANVQRLELEVSVREDRGRGASRRIRAEGGVPAILYGGGAEPRTLAVDAHSLERVIRSGANALIDLKGPEAIQGRLVLIKELQRNPVSTRILHCDFYSVDTSKPLHVFVPLHFEGKPPGVELGGVFEILTREVEIRCLPLGIPDRIPVDISALQIGDTVHLADIEIPEGTEALAASDLALAHVAIPRVVEEEEKPAEEAEEAAPLEGEAADEAAAKTEEKAGE